jgi:hypothetical protein
MKVNQIYSLVNDINKQLWGEESIDVHDLSGVIALGKIVMSSTDNMDKFLNKLVDRIGKTVVRTLDVELDFPSLFMDSFSFGAVLQKISVNPFEAIEEAEYNISNSNFNPTFADVHKCEIVVSYFNGVSTARFQRTIPDNLFFSAFTSETAMGNFIDAIIKAMADSMTMSLNNMSRTAVNNFIAEKIKVNNGVINLLTDYNSQVGQGNEITVAQALRNEDFLKYASNVIRKYIKYLAEPSALYNTGVADESGGVTKVVRATTRDNMHVLFNTSFVSAEETYLQADTFHDDLVSLPNYTEVGYWQSNYDSQGNINTFETNTSINVIPSSEEGKETKTPVNQSGVIGVLADRQAIAVSINRERTGAFRNDIDAYTNVAMSFSKNWLNDLSENGIVFIIADKTEGE